MCFSAYAQYAPRPVKPSGDDVRAAPTPDVLADPNIFGPLPVPPAPEDAPARDRPPAGSLATIESVVVTMPDGRRFLMTPLD